MHYICLVCLGPEIRLPWILTAFSSPIKHFLFTEYKNPVRPFNQCEVLPTFMFVYLLSLVFCGCRFCFHLFLADWQLFGFALCLVYLWISVLIHCCRWIMSWILYINLSHGLLSKQKSIHPVGRKSWVQITTMPQPFMARSLDSKTGLDHWITKGWKLLVKA